MNCSYDFMHCKHLGSDMVQFGSILHLLVHQILPHEPLGNLQVCYKFILGQYKKLNITERFRGMRKLSLFQRKSGGPKLKGRAKQIACLGGPLLALWSHYMNPHLEVHLKIKLLLHVNCLMENVLKDFQGELALPQPQANQFKDWSFAYCQLHRDLSQFFLEDEASAALQLFAEVPKLHMLLHTCLQCDILHPKLTWCYRGEDAMKIARTLASSCAKGSSGPQVCNKMVSKLMVALHMRMVALEG